MTFFSYSFPLRRKFAFFPWIRIFFSFFPFTFEWLSSICCFVNSLTCFLLLSNVQCKGKRREISMNWNLIIEINKNMISESDILSTLFLFPLFGVNFFFYVPWCLVNYCDLACKEIPLLLPFIYAIQLLSSSRAII